MRTECPALHPDTPERTAGSQPAASLASRLGGQQQLRLVPIRPLGWTLTPAGSVTGEVRGSPDVWIKRLPEESSAADAAPDGWGGWKSTALTELPLVLSIIAIFLFAALL